MVLVGLAFAGEQIAKLKSRTSRSRSDLIFSICLAALTSHHTRRGVWYSATIPI